MKPVLNAPEGDILKLLAEGQGIEPRQHPQYFFSSRSLMRERLYQQTGVVKDPKSMHTILKADEERYKTVFQTHRVAQMFGASKAREAAPSRYPWYEFERWKEAQWKAEQPQTQTVFLRATVANVPTAGQPIILQQDFNQRRPSWQMSDADDAAYDNARR